MVNPPRPMVDQRRSSRRGERGQALEYALIIAVVGAGLLGALGLVASTTKRLYTRTSAATALPAAYPAADGGMAMTTQSPGESVPSAGSTVPPDSTGNVEPSDSLAESPDSLTP